MASTKKRRIWQESLNDEVSSLERTSTVFERIEGDPRFSYNLPRKNALAGAVLKHCYAVVDSVLEKFYPLIYKFGYCHCLFNRFYNQKWGYFYEKHCQWEHMKLLYISAEPISPGFVEASLIQRHKGHLI